MSAALLAGLHAGLPVGLHAAALNTGLPVGLHAGLRAGVMTVRPSRQWFAIAPYSSPRPR
ncbi:hypothetical protein JZM24_01985 [Candidatus Sodalis endolongispinus]|uniref:Uncharacterized protein n=1 Tax=Candidatus Sodalis endolongispinus TaxID=2812662 RepID=A0ABS5Y931_9GAMM|nr:hypothetical protein [Candidatus Sodalis endolongispinus]MBT9431237.1 hypothetical protein [Candidatus Sodalis endolongispinus]